MRKVQRSASLKGRDVDFSRILESHNHALINNQCCEWVKPPKHRVSHVRTYMEQLKFWMAPYYHPYFHYLMYRERTGVEAEQRKRPRHRQSVRVPQPPRKAQMASTTVVVRLARGSQDMDQLGTVLTPIWMCWIEEGSSSNLPSNDDEPRHREHCFCSRRIQTVNFMAWVSNVPKPIQTSVSSGQMPHKSYGLSCRLPKPRPWLLYSDRQVAPRTAPFSATDANLVEKCPG